MSTLLANVSVTNSVFENNVAALRGGAVAVTAGALNMSVRGGARRATMLARSHAARAHMAHASRCFEMLHAD